MLFKQFFLRTRNCLTIVKLPAGSHYTDRDATTGIIRVAAHCVRLL